MGDFGDSILEEIEVRPTVFLKLELAFMIMSQFSSLFFAILEIQNARDRSGERERERGRERERERELIWEGKWWSGIIADLKEGLSGGHSALVPLLTRFVAWGRLIPPQTVKFEFLGILNFYALVGKLWFFLIYEAVDNFCCSVNFWVPSCLLFWCFYREMYNLVDLLEFMLL